MRSSVIHEKDPVIVIQASPGHLIGEVFLLVQGRPNQAKRLHLLDVMGMPWYPFRRVGGVLEEGGRVISCATITPATQTKTARDVAGDGWTGGLC